MARHYQKWCEGKETPVVEPTVHYGAGKIMAEEQKEIKINLDPNLYAVVNVNIAFDEEQFVFTIFSGNQARQFSVSPKHAKRLFLLLEKQINEYEKKFGILETKLPEKTETGKEKPIGFKK